MKSSETLLFHPEPISCPEASKHIFKSSKTLRSFSIFIDHSRQLLVARAIVDNYDKTTKIVNGVRFVYSELEPAAFLIFVYG